MKHKQLKSSAKSIQKKKFFVSVEHRAIRSHPYFVNILLVMSSSLDYRDKERQRKRESRWQASQAQRERALQRARERRQNCSHEQRERESEKETEKGGAILWTSNGRGSEKETEH